MLKLFKRAEAEAELKAKNTEQVIESMVKAVKDDIVNDLLVKTSDKMREILEAEGNVSVLKKAKARLEDQIMKLESEKKLEETQIKALVKLHEDRHAIALQQKEMELETEYHKKEMSLVKKHHDDLLKAMKDHEKRLDSLVEQVMMRLTNINNSEHTGTKVEVVK
jgi:hypothetical protein